jgi:hypothetical protein
VLVDAKGLSTAQIAGLVSKGAKRFVTVGADIPAVTLGKLRAAVGRSNVTTTAGSTIASTSDRFASWATSTLGMTWDGLGVASDSNWSRTPIAALLKGRAGTVLLMSGSKSLSAPVKSALVRHHRSIKHLSFVGTKGFISMKVRGQVRLAIK